MPARRRVVAAASGVLILSLVISSPAGAAKQQGNNGDNDTAERTATTEKDRAKPKNDDKGDDKPDNKADKADKADRGDAKADAEKSAKEERTTTTRRESTTTTRQSEKTAPQSTSEPKAERTETVAATADAPTTTTTEEAKPTKRYIVVLKKGNRSSQVAEEHARTRHVNVQKVYGHALRGYAADIADDEIDAVKKDKRVAYVERDKEISAFAQTLPWGVERVSRKGDDWSSTRPGDGSGAVDEDIYVIDTGIEPQADLNGGTEVNFRGGPSVDCAGHGTHMAGIAGAIDNTNGVVGVAPGARVHGIKVLDCNGRGTDLNAIAGLDWVVEHGARPSVITMSFGGPISRAFDDSVRRAVSAGFTVIAAAGNDHKNACSLSPAHLGEMNGVITVGATTKNDKRAGFSNFGPCVDLYAPGVRIPSYFLNGQLALATGTSASAPHVAGIAALYLVGPGSDSPADAEAAVKAHAVHVGSARRGLLIANAAEF